LALVVGANALLPQSLSAEFSIALRVTAVAVSLMVAIVLLRTGIRSAGRPTPLPKPVYHPRTWLTSAAPLVLMGSMFMINANADILMLGSMSGPEAAGLYKAATRGAELLAFGVTVISVPLGPLLARLYAAGEIVRLQRELSRWARVAFVPAAALAVVFLAKGDWFLGLFGSEFSGREASAALAILTAGQLIHVAAGPVGLLLVMSGHERLAAKGLAVGATTNVFLNAVLIPTWGVRGAAVATACSTAIFALLLVAFAVRRLKLNPTVVPVSV
jgi:O-antigen/teichoic acid export membrane protein